MFVTSPSPAASQEAEQEPGESQEGDQEEGDHIQAVILDQVQVPTLDLQMLSAPRPSNKLKKVHSHVLRMSPNKEETVTLYLNRN